MSENIKKVDTFVAIDIEATGISPKKSRIIEIAAVKVEKGKIVDNFKTLVNPNVVLRDKIVELTGINNDMLKYAPEFKDVFEDFMKFIKGYVWLGHSILSDYAYIFREMNYFNIGKEGLNAYNIKSIDTLTIARKKLPEDMKKTLSVVCEYYNIRNIGEHRALNDAIATIKVYNKLIENFFETDKDVFEPKVLNYCQKQEKIKPITKKQLAHLSKLQKKYNLSFECEITKLKENEAARYIDKIILNYGRL